MEQSPVDQGPVSSRHSSAPERRRGVRSLAFALLALALVPAACRPSNTDEVRPPNVVIVLFDTLRPDRMGCYGYGRDTTPNIDAMADEFFVFEAAQSTAPWTAPALISLMTALYPDAHGVRTAPIPERLSDGARTLAQLLHGRGYATAAFTEGAYARGEFGLDKGFDVYHVEEISDEAPSHEGLTQRLPRNVDRALDWLSQRQEEPFLLFFHTYEVHSPQLPAEEHVRLFRPDYNAAEHEAAVLAAIERWNEHHEIDEAGLRLLMQEYATSSFMRLPSPGAPDLLREKAQELGVAFSEQNYATWPDLVTLVRDLYDADLRRTDEQLARLWEALRAAGQWENTVVVLASDHGEGLGDHGVLWHGATLHEALLRIVLMIRTPDAGLEPRRVREVASIVDVMPTILDLTGTSAEGLVLQGRSLLPVLRGTPSSRAAYSHAGRRFRNVVAQRYTIRTQEWRLVVDEDEGWVRLFDLRNDPAELSDVSAREPEITAELLERLTKQRAVDAALRRRLGPNSATGELDAAAMRELEMLGYLGDLEDR